ncbi:hypothetical protein MCEGEM3_02619 [Oxalobacteraceae bacterium]
MIKLNETEPSATIRLSDNGSGDFPALRTAIQGNKTNRTSHLRNALNTLNDLHRQIKPHPTPPKIRQILGKIWVFSRFPSLFYYLFI